MTKAVFPININAKWCSTLWFGMVAVPEEPGRRVLPEPITLIKNADWIIAWDEDLGHHYYLKTGSVLPGPFGQSIVYHRR